MSTDGNKTAPGESVGAEDILTQLTLDYALTHEDRLLEGLCSPKASSLYLDLLDSLRGANTHLMPLCDRMIKLAESPPSA